MELGIPKERGLRAGFAEKRVGLAPVGVEDLASAGARVYVEKDAGLEAGFSNEEYASAGAEVVYTAEEVYGRSRVIAKVGPPQQEVWPYLLEKQLIMGFLHLAVASGDLLDIFLKQKIQLLVMRLCKPIREDFPS